MKYLRAPAFVSTLSFVASFAPEAVAAEAAPDPVRVDLMLVVPALPDHWELEIVNRDSVAARVVVDPSLVSLEVLPSAAGPKAKPTRCSLPPSMRPSADAQNAQLLSPGASYVMSVDPKLLCFGAKAKAGVLGAGATVTAHYGFTPKAGKRAVEAPPFVAVPTKDDVGRYSAQKELTATPLTLPDSWLVDPALPREVSLPPPPPDDPTYPTQLKISGPSSLDSPGGSSLPVNVSVQNDGVRPAWFLLRPTTLRFAVQGPAGEAVCERSVTTSPTGPDSFTKLVPRGKASVTIDLRLICPSKTFSRPGLYRVYPMLDARNADGRDFGLMTFRGVVVGSPTLIRLQQGEGRDG